MSSSDEFARQFNLFEPINTIEMANFTTLIHFTPTISARSTNNIPLPQPIPRKVYITPSVSLLFITLLLITFFGVLLVYCKGGPFFRKRKWDAGLGQDTHLAEAINREQDIERGSTKRHHNGLEDIPLNGSRHLPKVHISTNPSPLAWVRLLGNRGAEMANWV